MQNLINGKQRVPFILVIEGVDFSGKTTLAHQIQEILMSQSYRVKLLHDPKGSKNAEVIWKTILTIKNEDPHPITEFFLFLAARHELIYKEAMVNDVDVIIFDRFIFSTIAYQLTHEPNYWKHFLMMHRIFSGLMPDLCIYCDMHFDTFQLRNQARSKQDPFDQMSQKRFEAIQEAYKEALAIEICPYIQVNEQHYDTSELIKSIIEHMATKKTDLPSI